jgi:prepilin-type N-terminal cleavage/methylation domain-containing protein
MNKRRTNHQQGFTILELLIATTVLSVILLLVTTMILSIGNLFYKGMSQAKVQDAVRSIVDDVSKQIELSGEKPQPGPIQANPQIYVYCVGDTRYSYVLNAVIGQPLYGSSSPIYYHALWRDSATSDCHANTGIKAADLTNPNLTGGTELVPANSRLTGFCFGTYDSVSNKLNCTPGGSPYTIAVSVATGDSDLLCDNSATAPPDCSDPSFTTHMQQIFSNAPGSTPLFGAIRCKGLTGDQFCATAQLTVTVANRL